MRDASHDRRLSLFGRRNFLRTTGVAAASLAMAGTASAYHDNYDAVVDIVEEGADDSGGESINPVLDDLEEDSILIEFPDGEYRMDRQFRHTEFSEFGLVAKGDDATIVPVQAGDWNGGERRRLFKLGTHYAPGGRLRIEGLTFDYTAPNTGLRAIQAQVDDPLVRDVDVVGRHDTGNWGPGPLLVDVTDPDGTGLVERVDLRDGGEMAPRSDGGMIGPIGFNVGRDHRGTLEVRRCHVYRFPNNGLYVSTEDGRVVVYKGRYRNSHVSNIRLSGRKSEVNGSHVVVRESPDGWDAQVGIRLDGGNHRLRNVVIWSPRPTANGIRVMEEAESARIENALIAYGPGRGDDSIHVAAGSGPVTVADTEIRQRGSRQAIHIESSGEPVVVENVEVNGEASGSPGGRHAIRCARANCEFRDVSVDQPGDDYRRCLTLVADDCTVAGGSYTSTHHPIVVDSSGATVDGVEAKANNDSEGIKVYGGHGGIEVVDSTVWNGIRNDGSDVHTSGNEYPES